MISTQSYRTTMGIEPIQQNPAVMDRFDKMVLRAAKNKRKDIISRYGHEGCEKLLTKGKHEEKEEDPELLKENYEKTIQSLLDALEESPLDKLRIESARKLYLTKSPNPKRKRGLRIKDKNTKSSRLNLELLENTQIPTKDNSEKSFREKKGERIKRIRKKKFIDKGAREKSKEKTIRRPRKSEILDEAIETSRIAAIEQVERESIEKKNFYSRRKSIGSTRNAASRKVSVHKAVKLWEGRGTECTKSSLYHQRRMSC